MNETSNIESAAPAEQDALPLAELDLYSAEIRDYRKKGFNAFRTKQEQAAFDILQFDYNKRPLDWPE